MRSKLKLHKKERKELLLLLFIIGCLYGVYYIFLSLKLKTSDTVVTVNVGDNYDTSNVSAFIGLKDISEKIQVNGTCDTSVIGSCTLIYSVNYGVYHKTLEQTVNVVDTVSPRITLEGESEVSSCSVDSVEEAGYNALDNYDGDITDKVVVSKSDHSIIYEVEDSSGNKETVERIVKVEDTVAPTITLNGNSSISILQNSTYNEEGATAVDNCLGDLSSRIEITGSVDTSNLGTYKVNYKVTDDAGNTSEVNRTVIVTDEIKKGLIYLTFDDGPGSYTSSILDTLKKYNVKATFFVTNNGSDALIKREYEEGHTVGLHTATHKWDIYDSTEAYFNDLSIVANRVYNITGEYAKFIRFPGGSSNTVSRSHSKGIMTLLTSLVGEKGYTYFDWNVCVEDAGACAKSGVSDRTSCVVNYFKKGLSKSRINIVLLHDIKSYTANGLEEMIKYALNNGYEFKRIDETTAPVHFKVAN